MAITLTQACPHIRAIVVDLLLVTPITQKIVKEARATDRVSVLAADVVRGPLPGAYDVAVVRELLQVLSPDAARRAVQNIGAAVNPGGTIYIINQILDDTRTAPLEAIGFNLNFVNRFYTGESYTEHEHRRWLREAGFVDIERAGFLLNDGYGNGIMTAHKRV